MPIKSWLTLLDDAGASSGSFDPLPDGDYNFEVAHAEAKQTTQSKTIYTIKASVKSGPYAGRVVWHEFVLQPNNPIALTQLFRSFEVIGIPISFFKTDPSDHHVANELIGKEFRGQIIIRSTKNVERNEIVQFYSSNSSTSLATAATTASQAPAGLAPAPAYSAPAPAFVPDPVANPDRSQSDGAQSNAALDAPSRDDDDVALTPGTRRPVDE